MGADMLALLGAFLIFAGWVSARIQRHGLGRDDA